MDHNFKLCSDCKHYREMKYCSTPREPASVRHICMLRTRPDDVDVVSGNHTYYLDSPRSVSVHNERKKSYGFFGIGKDRMRCGPDGANFEEKTELEPSNPPEEK